MPPALGGSAIAWKSNRKCKRKNNTKCLKNPCKTLENSNFMKKGKTVISVKIQNFSRSWMKQTSPLESSCEI